MDDKGISYILAHAYGKLLGAYGHQHWWPADSPFEVIIGAILTQSTAWANVEKAIARLKEAECLSSSGLREMPEEELAGLIYSCGYYNAKARKLKAFAEWMCADCNDDLHILFSCDIDALRAKLLAVHGIGEETADSIILYAAGKPVFVIDAYTRRIIGRMGLSPQKENYASYQGLFNEALPEDAKLFNEYHALLVRHGKEVCRRLPRCEDCCLNHHEKAREQDYPCSSFGRQAIAVT